MAFKQGKLVNFSVIFMPMLCASLFLGVKGTPHKGDTVSGEGLFWFLFFPRRRYFVYTHISCYMQTNEQHTNNTWGKAVKKTRIYSKQQPKPEL